MARAVASRETWSGITLWWPVGSDHESDWRLPIELSGLPLFDRDRNFRGYRGFGVCRDLVEALPPGGLTMQVLRDVGLPEALEAAREKEERVQADRDPDHPGVATQARF